MKKICSVILISFILCGCTTPLIEEVEQSPSTVEVVDEANELYFDLTEEEIDDILEMITSSGVFDEYNPDYPTYPSVFGNYIEVFAQPKDYPTFSLQRYLKTTNNDYSYSEYAFERFYRIDTKFTYVKFDSIRNAELEITYYCNPGITKTNSFDHLVECHLFAPSSDSQHYSFYYDVIDESFYKLNHDKIKEEITFTDDLQEKLVFHCKKMIKQLNEIDENAQILARDIIDFINEKESD